MRGEGLTTRMAAFIAELPEQRIPAEARRIASTAILDTIGVTFAGANDEIGRIMTAYVQEQGGNPTAVIVGGGFRSSTLMAALANGTMAHALDFDDTSHPMYAHPSCHLVPALLALAEERKINGRTLVTSYLLGFEFEARLSHGLPFQHGSAFHPTATLGTMGAAAACARLLGLDAQKTAMALGIAVSEAAGTYQNMGSMTKPFHAGRAAMNGVMAACLAEKGLTSSPEILEGRSGFLRIYGTGEEPKWEAMEADLGNVWEITLPYGMAIKPYPACGAAHPSIQATLELLAEHRLDPKAVKRVDVGTSNMLRNVLIYDDPQWGHQGRFSLPHTVAAALLEGRVGPEQFSDQYVQRPEVIAMRQRIHYAVDTEVADNPEFGAIVRVQMQDGRTLARKVLLAKGKNANPMSLEEILTKFHACVEPSLPSSDAKRLAGLLGGIDDCSDLSPIAALLVKPRSVG